MRYSIVRYSEVVAAGFRTDAEYWHPEFIRNSALVSTAETIGDFVLPNVANIKSSPIGRAFEYLEIAGISTSSCEYRTSFVARGDEPDRAHYILEPGDVVVSTVRPNRNAVALIVEEGIVGSSGLAVLRTDELEPAYLFAFCKTDYFIKCLVRANKATMYPAVSVRDVLDTPIFTGSREFRALVSGCVVNALELQYDARDAYSAAETILLADLQFDEWQPRRQSWSVRQYSETLAAGRMDAEYFHPKYDGIIDAIKNCAGGYDTLGNLVTMRKCIEVGSGEYLDEGIPFVRVSNLSPFEITYEKYISESLYTRIRKHQPRQGEILFSKDATPGIAHYLAVPPPRMIPSGGILRLRRASDRVNDEYLALVLNAFPTQQQVQRDGGGSIILHWRPDQVAATLIPILPPDRQDAIQRRVAEATTLRQRSRRLLASAVGAVQRAIEQGEAAAIAGLEAETPGILG